MEHMRSSAVGIALAIGTIVSAPRGQPSATTSLEAVVDRASRFAERQRDALANVVADEHYLQQLEFPSGGVFQTRRLESEMAFVRLGGSVDWMAFRSVLRVDGEPTGNDPGGLEMLFREGATGNLGRRLADENAIHNIGGLRRNFNIPTFVQHILMPQQIARFVIRKVSEELDGAGQIWILEYRERHRPTIVRFDGRRDVPVKGRLWIRPEDGSLVKATLSATVPVASELEFRWQHDERLHQWVPAEMRERYRRLRYERVQAGAQPFYDIVCVATYSNYRRFAVDVRIK
jgi:hypothetical protein